MVVVYRLEDELNGITRSWCAFLKLSLSSYMGCKLAAGGFRIQYGLKLNAPDVLLLQLLPSCAFRGFSDQAVGSCCTLQENKKRSAVPAPSLTFLKTASFDHENVRRQQTVCSHLRRVRLFRTSTWHDVLRSPQHRQRCSCDVAWCRSGLQFFPSTARNAAETTRLGWTAQ